MYRFEQLTADSPKTAAVLAIYQQNPAYFALTGQVPDLRLVQQDIQIKPASVLPEYKTFFLITDEQQQQLGVLDLLVHYPETGTAYIGLFMTRQKGLGSEILIQIVEALQAENFKRIKIGVLIKNRAALRFWEKMGFIVTGQTDIMIEDAVFAVHTMERSIRLPK